MSTDYGYPNARIRAMKSYLLDAVFYEKLLDMEDISSITLAFETTPYKKDIAEATLRYPGLKGIEEALRKNLALTFRKIIEIVEGVGKEYVKVLLGRWDLHNIKTILRGKHHGIKEDEIFESLVPAASLDEVALHHLVKQVEIKDCLDLMATWGIPYARPLLESFPEYLRTHNLADLELALDKFYYQHSLDRIRGYSLNACLVREILVREIDFVNIMTLLRVVREGLDLERASFLFIPGGKEIDQEKFLALAQSESIEELVKQLKGTAYWPALEKGLKQYLEIGSLSVLERSMEDLIIRKGVQMFKADPLSIALIIGYLTAKYNEVVNLRLLIRCKAVGMPAQRIREALVIV